MSELQGRGYLIAHSANYLRDAVGKEEWDRIYNRFSPELQDLLNGKVKHADWYPISFLNEVTGQITSVVGKGDDERAQEALYVCGRYIAREATNTFLKILLKMLTPNLFAKKLPTIFGRDFSSGRMDVAMNGNVINARIFDAPGLNHGIITSTGFVATAIEAMGKKVESIKVHDWSIATPNVDGTSFDLTWSD